MSFRRYVAVKGSLLRSGGERSPIDKSAILHTYRSLLRAATYLPDSLARSRVHNEIVLGFHKRRAKKNLPPNLLASLQKRIDKLQRAADHHAENLTSVLRFAYGQSGTVRRARVAQLLNTPSADVPTDSKSLQDLILQEREGKTTAARVRFANNAKLNALVASQKLHGAHFEGLKLRALKPDIPKRNIWMRTTPVKVVANLEKKWWARTLSIVCPPAPEDEWHRLEALSLGKLKEESPHRRTRVECSSAQESAMPSLNDLTERIKGKPAKECGVLTNRGMRTIYSQLWAASPLMSYNDTKKKWSVQWGRVSNISRAGLKAIPQIRSEELFDGIERFDYTIPKRSDEKRRDVKTKEELVE